MANISKYTFAKCISPHTPCSVFHPWSSHCRDGIPIFVYNMLFGSAKFFLPIYVVKVMLNYKKINRKYITNQIGAYLRSICYGIAFGGLLLTSCCVICKVHLNYFILLQAGAVSGLSLLLESTENKNIDKILFFNQVIEVFINSLSSNKIIRRTRCTETITFMFVASSLMYLFKTRVKRLNVPFLWFYQEKSIYQGDTMRNGLSPEEACNHKQSCLNYSLEGAQTFFFIGYLLEIIRRFLPKMFNFIRNPQLIPHLMIKRDNVMMGCFLGGFVGLYRFICCYFQRKEHKVLPSHALIAAFVASGTYYLKPNVQILIIALTSMLQLLWERWAVHFNLPKTIPYSQILFCVCAGILLHCRFLQSDQCPNYVINMIDVATNNTSKEIYAHFLMNIKATKRYLNNLE